MGGAEHYLTVAAVVFGVNLMPAFGPPTWSVLVFFNVTYDLPVYVLVPLGAVAAASGRLVLGSVAKRYRGLFGERRVRELDALREVVERRRGVSLSALMLFAISPVPSSSLFIAAGAAGMRLVRLTLAFFSGRIVSYSIYVTASSAAEESIRDLFDHGVTSPWSIAFQVAVLLFVIALVFMPWSRILGSAANRSGATNGAVD